MIEVKNLVKRYGGHVAVDHLSFQIESGKIYGFLGPNGAGKSTTMNIMTGYIAPSEGSVKINGHDIVTDADAAKRCIGYLPEIPPLYQDMTVREYLGFSALLKGIPKKNVPRQVQEVMELVLLTDMAGRLIKNLSKGYKQRVGLAQAVMGYPEVIILDEPTVGLDPKQIIEIRDLIRKLGEKHTVILSSHILSEVQAVCDEIMIISKGKLVACDTPDGLMGLMNGSADIELHIKGSSDSLRQAISGISEIREYELKEDSEKEEVKAILKTDASKDIRIPLFYALAEQRLPILSLYRREKSLEDVFLELTENKTDGEAETPAEVQIEDQPESRSEGQIEDQSESRSEGQNENQPEEKAQIKKTEANEGGEEHESNL